MGLCRVNLIMYIGLTISVQHIFSVVPVDINICRGRSGPDLGFSDHLVDPFLIGKWDIGKCRDSARRWRASSHDLSLCRCGVGLRRFGICRRSTPIVRWTLDVGSYFYTLIYILLDLSLEWQVMHMRIFIKGIVYSPLKIPNVSTEYQVPHITLYAVDHTAAGASSTIRTLRPITMAKTYICTNVSEWKHVEFPRDNYSPKIHNNKTLTACTPEEIDQPRLPPVPTCWRLLLDVDGAIHTPLLQEISW